MSTTTLRCECLRCNGTGILPTFRHIVDGVCFACGGVGTVDRNVQIDGNRPSSPAVRSKVVDLPRFGSVEITRHGAGFRAEGATGCVWFDVVAGRVANIIASDAIGRRAAEFAADLQGALRA